MYAVVKIQGHQYIVKNDDVIVVDRLEWDVNDSVLFNDVLITFSEDQENTVIGSPLVKWAQVKAHIVEHKKWKKIRVLKFQSKKRYQRVKWHRSYQTVLHIDSVSV
jgi:large subunit ribosomal protein L21